jgi:quercetin dioxygenase-like cupin family protein
MRAQAIPTVQIENERVIVTEWRFAPGAETGWHTHGHDYVVVPMTHGTLLLETDEGPITGALVQGRSYTRKVGVKHNVVNAGVEELVFIEVELR